MRERTAFVRFQEVRAVSSGVPNRLPLQGLSCHAPADWRRLIFYLGAGTALDSLAEIAWRAASNRSHAALSGRDGMVTISPWSRPASAASTVSSADITISAGRLRTGSPAMSQNYVAVAPGRTAWTRTSLPASSRLSD